MSGDNQMGSDELSPEEFDLAELQNDETLAEFYKVIEQSDQAKAFIRTPFGIALRKTLVGESLRAMKACADAFGSEADTIEAQVEYRVIKKVQSIFGYIISDGEEALRQLQVRFGDDNDY